MKKVLFPGLLFILILALAACGGNGGSESTESTEAVTTTASAGMTQLVTTAQNWKIQHACVNRTMRPCGHVDDLISEIFERTNGHVDITITSYPELGIGGTDMIRLVGDGTVGFGEIYGGFVGSEYPIFDVINLWGAFETPEQYFQASDAVEDHMKRLIRRETDRGEIIAFNYYPINFYFSKKQLNTLDDIEGLKTRVHSGVLQDLVNTLGGSAQFMTFADVYPALERGVLDAAVTCSTCAIGQKWYEVTDYLTGPFPGTFGQTFIKEVGKEYSEESIRLVFEWDDSALQELIDLGMTHKAFTPEMSATVAGRRRRSRGP